MRQLTTPQASCLQEFIGAESRAIRLQIQTTLGNSSVALTNTLPGLSFLRLQNRESNKYLTGLF